MGVSSRSTWVLIPDFLYPLVQSALLLLCGYKSFNAIDTKETKDDIKWLTFWLVYSVLAFAKSILDMVSILIPLYNELNLAAIVYLAFFGGAQLPSTCCVRSSSSTRASSTQSST